MTINTKSRLLLSLTAILLLGFATPAKAEDIASGNAQTMDMPSLSASVNPDEMTHPILRLTRDKSEMVHLDQEAASVIIGNPNHVSVLLDTPTTLIVVPRAEGASHFTVIGKDGSVLMQRHVIVGTNKEQYVRIRRSCSATDRGCEPTSVYFCPDMCHEVKENNQTTGRR